jgi:type IV secretory pathway VirB10-like protein
MAMNPQIKDKNKIRAGATLNISGTKAGARSVAAKKIKTIPTLKVKGRALKTAKQRREENKAKRKESDEKHEKAVERRLAGKSAERRTESAIQRGDARYPAGGGTRAITKEESDEQARIRKERRGDRTRDKYRGRRSWWRQLTR